MLNFENGQQYESKLREALAMGMATTDKNRTENRKVAIVNAY